MIKLKSLLRENIFVYHSGNYEIGKSDPNMQRSGYYPGLYVTPNPNIASTYGPNIKKFILKPDLKFWDFSNVTADRHSNIDKLKSDAEKAGFRTSQGSGYPEVQYLKSIGYDGIRRGSELVLFDPDKALLKYTSLMLDIDAINKEYPLAGDSVDGRTVLDNVDNTSSIDASLYHYKVLGGIREVPMFKNITGKGHSVEENNRIKQLAYQIGQSNEISPLIVVVDKKGPYILEGGHRISALVLLKAKSFPALMVIDYD